MKIATVLVLFAVTACIGCGPKTAPVSGRVTFDDKPGENIVVLFQSKAGGETVPESAFGRTDSDGRFSLSLMNSKKAGVIPGDYSVIISWKSPEKVEVVEGEKYTGPVCPYKIPNRASTGQLTFTVPPEGSKDANFAFTLEDLKNDTKEDR